MLTNFQLFHQHKFCNLNNSIKAGAHYPCSQAMNTGV